MIGQGRPIVWNFCSSARLAMRTFRFSVRTLLLMVSLWTAIGPELFAKEVNVRLRIAWGSGDSTKQRWVGRIGCPGAKLSDLQPLGIETDASVAIQLINNELVVEPREVRGFDGCDVTVVGEESSLVRFELRSEQASSPTVVEVPLEKLGREQVRESIDTLGSVLLAYRSPGDRFRLITERENLIFKPGEAWPVRLQTDFAEELAVGPVTVDTALRTVGSDAVLWQGTQVIAADLPAANQLMLEIVLPKAEGAYRLSLSASAEQSFATRFVPGQGPKPFATRDIDLVVIDSAAKLPPLVDKWVPVLSIDPANPGWWQRLPTWAQVSRLTGKPPGTLGNVRLLARSGDANGLVELAPPVKGQDPTWQSFALPIQEVGVPHLVEIAYPLAEKQRLGISIIEPDASGRVTAAVLNSALCVEEVIEATPGEIGVHRLLFWPRTQSPQLMIVNRHANHPGVFGRITLSRQDPATQPSATESNTRGRLVASYFAKPVFAQNFGATELLDIGSGKSVQGWSTFLDGAHRLTQFLKLSGYNGVFVSVAADGSAIYPSEHLLPSPRYDTGLSLAASGQDPIRKDILEMLLRVTDREAIRVVPTLQLLSPLPNLEAQLRLTSTNTAGAIWTNAQGRPLTSVRRAHPAANYNLLNPTVQQEISAVVTELIDRCGKHSSFEGIALQLDSNGYGMLPGLEWGFDDQTVAAFSADTGIKISAAGEKRFEERAAVLLDEHRAAWQEWRIKRVLAFYEQLAAQIRAERADLRLVLLTENLFAEPSLEQAIRRNVTQSGRLKELLAERGIVLERLAAIPGVEITNAQRIAAPEHLQEHVSDLVVNEATQAGGLGTQGTNLSYHDVSLARLVSFDQQSPFGNQTHLVLAYIPECGAPFDTNSASTKCHIEGGDFLPLTVSAERARQLRSLAQLPDELSDVRLVCDQPLGVTIARTPSETYLICTNDLPWSISGKMELESSSEVAWQLLGEHAANLAPTGRLSGGRSFWPINIDSHGTQVWRFMSPQVRPGVVNVTAAKSVRSYLEQRIAEIDDRTGNLNIKRDYPQLQNPGFELEDGESRIFGWQPRKGVDGSIEVETANVHAGQRALRLKSTDTIGVAAQSHLFPLPETGMLVVTAQIRASDLSENSTLTLAVETDEHGQSYRRTRSFPLGEEYRTQWKECELVVGDLPVGDAEQIRVQLHVTGKADVVVDDIALCDLRFDNQRRSELVKRVFAAKTALEEGQYADCLRLLNEYWPQYLVAYVPPVDREPALAKEPAKSSTPETEEGAKNNGRLRNIIPRIWR